MREGFVVTGAVIGAHGIRGELKVKILTDFPERFGKGQVVLAGPKDESFAPREFTIESSRENKGRLIVKLRGVDDRNSAEAMDGFLFLSDKPKRIEENNRYYIFDIEGLEVFDLEGKRIGRVEEVITAPANDVYLVRGDGREYLVPALKTFIKDINLAEKTMHVDMEKMDIEN